MNLRWHLARVIGPLWRLLPPYWRVRAYHHLVGEPFGAAPFGGVHVLRHVAPHGHVMRLDLGDWMERLAAFIGIFYEIEVTQTIVRLVPPGSDFVDIGGNLGFTSLIASSCVGDQGRVIYVEPNPALVTRFRDTIQRNAIANIAIVEAAFGSAPGTLALAVARHHGQSQLESHVDAASASIPVTVIDEASVLPLLTEGQPCFIKIDVEGFEQIVLAGMSRLLDRPRTCFLIELTDDWLRRNGGSADELWDVMMRHGFHGYLPTMSALQRGVRFEPITHAPTVFQSDVLFMRPG
ncbi:MAG: hypothetical protein RLZZ58_2152 [Pseudomonadota bacterium]